MKKRETEDESKRRQNTSSENEKAMEVQREKL